MYRFAGYLIRNAENVVVQYAPTRQAAAQSAQQLNPGHTITQIFEWISQPVIESVEPATSTIIP